MKNIESIEEFYKRKFDWLPENVSKDIGHFNVFKLKPISDGEVTAIPYRRRDFYKVMLIKGNAKVYYADKVYEVKKQALAFSNPLIPYKWDHLDKIYDGVYCIFNSHFFHQFGHFSEYEVFQPNGNHIFELSDEQVHEVQERFDTIEEEFNSGYKYKFDMVRNRVLDLIHFGLKLEPSNIIEEKSINAAYRISKLFIELLERQFPIDDTHQSLELRSASDFAEKLNVHVNHLNRVIKETTEKTTTQIILERIVQEAKVLLKHTSWNISEIAYALGFSEVTHFNNFFKKQLEMSPTNFRKSIN